MFPQPKTTYQEECIRNVKVWLRKCVAEIQQREAEAKPQPTPSKSAA